MSRSNEDIEALVAAFKAKGGQVQQLPPMSKIRHILCHVLQIAPAGYIHHQFK